MSLNSCDEMYKDVDSGLTCDNVASHGDEMYEYSGHSCEKVASCLWWWDVWI